MSDVLGEVITTLLGIGLSGVGARKAKKHMDRRRERAEEMARNSRELETAETWVVDLRPLGHARSGGLPEHSGSFLDRRKLHYKNPYESPLSYMRRVFSLPFDFYTTNGKADRRVVVARAGELSLEFNAESEPFNGDFGFPWERVWRLNYRSYSEYQPDLGLKLIPYPRSLGFEFIDGSNQI